PGLTRSPLPHLYLRLTILIRLVGENLEAQVPRSDSVWKCNLICVTWCFSLFYKDINFPGVLAPIPML
ncbi:MAG: hypothetical protein O2793_17155, partial [Proteobacteria bacterium]|nr:hypothetical protein [Pseudomonadota bacterium]